MKENLKEYLTYIDNILKDEKVEKELPINHLTQIKFWQHERLVHLIVTVFTGSMAILFLLFATISNNLMLYLPFLALIILFIPYIFYYYFLENGVQKLYKQYWSLLEKTKK